MHTEKCEKYGQSIVFHDWNCFITTLQSRYIWSQIEMDVC
jgi:hypothetical protein